MTRFAVIFLALLVGCAQDLPLSKRDHEFARKDLELDREKYKTFAGSKEREGVDQQIKEHNIDRNKIYLIDEINLGSNTPEKQYPSVPKDEADRIKQINELIDKQLHGAHE